MKLTKIFFPDAFKVTFEDEDLNPEQLGDSEILVENHFSLISPGTELAIYTGAHVGFSDPKNTWVKYPFHPGYSSSGTVVRTGTKVKRLNAGDAVYTSGYHASHQVFDLSGAEGAGVVAIPEGMQLLEAPFVKLAMIPTIVFEVGEYTIGDWAVVLGLGMIGNFAAQLLRLHGVGVVGLDPIEMRREVARRCGLKWALDPLQEDVQDRLKEITGGRGVAAVIEATGNHELVAPALKYLRPKGQFILLGSPRGKAKIDVYNDIHASGARLIGAHVSLHRFGPYGGMGPSLEYAMDMIHGGFVKTRELLTHTLKPQQIQEAYRLLLDEKDKALGIVLEWPAASAD